MTAQPATSERQQLARETMLGFAERTGLTSDRPPERYLWTDAFAVCNLLALDRVDLARRLVEQVHQVLGRHSGDDGRSGWLSGLPDEEAGRHPTRGGLRIGKKLPERRPAEPLDERLEWERDGQYFHYLTKWMHALDVIARHTGEGRYNLWARELAEVAHRAFVYFPPLGRGGRRMYWKMSVDLARPLVGAMGQHDPLDGYVTCLQLEAGARAPGVVADGPSLADAAADFRAMVPAELGTADPLGIGGLLTDAARLGQLRRAGVEVDEDIAELVREAAETGLEVYAAGRQLHLPAEFRLAFRELGLAIGLAGVELDLVDDRARLERFTALREEITGFWLRAENQAAGTWRQHREINEVMLATALVPDGFLRLAPAGR